MPACHRKARTVISVFGANDFKTAKLSFTAVIRVESYLANRCEQIGN